MTCCSSMSYLPFSTYNSLLCYILMRTFYLCFHCLYFSTTSYTYFMVYMLSLSAMELSTPFLVSGFYFPMASVFLCLLPSIAYDLCLWTLFRRSLSFCVIIHSPWLISNSLQHCMNLLVFICYREASTKEISNIRSSPLPLANLMISVITKVSIFCLISHDLNSMTKFVCFQNVVWSETYLKKSFLV